MYRCIKMRRRADGGAHLTLTSRTTNEWRVFGVITQNGFKDGQRLWTGEIVQSGPTRDELYFDKPQPTSESRATVIDIVAEHLLKIHHGDGDNIDVSA